ncbi:MAG: phosphatidylserine decarboxylase [Elusimicrobium sp.]|jgi:phosphatidylserine decarboxylase|nr:phosphatidylserine decarboxylase [Elusimicrobium sp.]
MLEDIKRTLSNALGWMTTILPEGIPWFLVTAAVALIASVFNGVLGTILFLVAIFFAFFFRNPKHNVIFNADEICCPADGKVISVKVEDDPNTVVVRIFLSVFNVHVQRAPMTCQVEDVIYTKGAFAFADAPGADKNERNLIKFSKDGKYAHVEQITGAIARRIKCWVSKSTYVKAGDSIGLIRFGSQVAVYMPKDAVRILVKEGQQVEGGTTVLGLWYS